MMSMRDKVRHYFRMILASFVAGLFLFAGTQATAVAAGPVVDVPAFVSISPFVTASQCAFCHGSNIDNFQNPILYFKHDAHLSRGVRCAGCHDQFPHGPGGTKRPGMTVCYSCHGLGHGNQGMVASGACSFCHPNGYGPGPASHTAGFKSGEHKKPAGQEFFSCRTCHASEMCSRCHTDRKVKPKNHADAKWRQTHGQERDTGGCEICHKNDFCTSCHVTPMPHPTAWEGEHKVTAKALKHDCKICHLSAEECSSCHHQFEGTTLLVEKSCVSCHEEYQQPLSTLTWSVPIGLRSKGVIVHKAHFEMTRTDPFDCDECHDRKYTTAKGCFGFELCYTCHGRERGGSLIAKWGGQELCYRCHQKK